MTTIKPKLFIGSARESIEYVDAIHEQLHYVAEVTPWSAGTFAALEYTMESLERQLDINDFAVFVFSPDDVVNTRGNITFKTRDNTLFEMGLFWGRLRRGRVFYIIPDQIPNQEGVEGYRLPSDLDGLTVLKYEIRTDQNFEAAVNRACRAIKTKIQELQFYADPSKLLEEAYNNTEKDYSIIRLLRKLSKELLLNPTRKYEYLTEGVRTAYQPPEFFSVEGIGVWMAEEHGLRQIAGNEGRDLFYEFGVNEGRQESERIIVVDCFLKSEESVLQKVIFILIKDMGCVIL
ncbi:TIR domain-containing protein [Bacillus sp. MRMR6]|uniref:TIR domain-containing protein n=1 Tax=Bacillus sp. MRMR6 TaxID=1928617 RepID=UPI0020C9EB39|nr:TIR domain-containing protein [Bacillus sp. MRMR6]